MLTPKQRMLNAYRNVKNDVIPAAPEFWFFYPAKILGIGIAEFQREVPHWKGLQATIKKFKCEGWGIETPMFENPHVTEKSEYKNIGDGKYRDIQIVNCNGKEFRRSYIYSNNAPYWEEEYAVKKQEEVAVFFDANINEDVVFNFDLANIAYDAVKDDFLIELNLGFTLFDYVEQFMGFQNALYYFMDEDEKILRNMLERYIQFQLRLINDAIKQTNYESYFVGCSSSCNALLGPTLWRKWEKPFYQAITEELHKNNKVIHNHNHGRIMETVPDLVEIGFDCVCPFERPPGDIVGYEGLKQVRELLNDKVTFNGNIHTVQALANGTAEDVRIQVREIKKAFEGSNRLIIGSGDQIAGETPEENIYAMIDETHKK